MKIININESDQFSIFRIIAGILHLGNISFKSNGNYAQPEQNDCNNIFIFLIELYNRPGRLIFFHQKTFKFLGMKKKFSSKT